jgi:hypothetical protein
MKENVLKIYDKCIWNGDVDLFQITNFPQYTYLKVMKSAVIVLYNEYCKVAFVLQNYTFSHREILVEWEGWV